MLLSKSSAAIVALLSFGVSGAQPVDRKLSERECQELGERATKGDSPADMDAYIQQCIQGKTTSGRRKSPEESDKAASEAQRPPAENDRKPVEAQSSPDEKSYSLALKEEDPWRYAKFLKEYPKSRFTGEIATEAKKYTRARIPKTGFISNEVLITKYNWNGEKGRRFGIDGAIMQINSERQAVLIGQVAYGNVWFSGEIIMFNNGVYVAKDTEIVHLRQQQLRK